MRIHASCVAIAGRGVLIAGPSGCGKSSLALQLLDRGAMLVTDDQTDLTAERGQLIASPPAAIAGMLEVRGVGIRRVPYRRSVALHLVVEAAAPKDISRLPEPAVTTLEGIRLPLFTLDYTTALAPMQVLECLGSVW